MPRLADPLVAGAGSPAPVGKSEESSRDEVARQSDPPEAVPCRRKAAAGGADRSDDRRVRAHGQGARRPDRRRAGALRHPRCRAFRLSDLRQGGDAAARQPQDLGRRPEGAACRGAGRARRGGGGTGEGGSHRRARQQRREERRARRPPPQSRPPASQPFATSARRDRSAQRAAPRRAAGGRSGADRR